MKTTRREELNLKLLASIFVTKCKFKGFHAEKNFFE
jgi:hypothetical protein